MLDLKMRERMGGGELWPICWKKYKYSDSHWAAGMGRWFLFLNWTELHRIIDVEERQKS